MVEPMPSGELSPVEQAKFLKANLSLQKAMLLLVERCHQPEYQATLNCSLKALDDDLNRRQMGGSFDASMKKVLTIVLSACFDVSREETIKNMQSGFALMDKHLAAQHKEISPEIHAGIQCAEINLPR